MEATTATLTTFGVTALIASWVALLITAWREYYARSLCTLFLPPLSQTFAVTRLDKAGDAVWLAVVGWVLIWAA